MTEDQNSSAPLRIALAGCGTVGSGVVRILRENSKAIELRAGRRIELRYVVIRDPAKQRQVSLEGCEVLTDFGPVVSDPEVSAVIQVMGGLEPARSTMLKFLNAGKDIITANKALLHASGPELFAVAKRLGRSICFEAAVAGGIPIIAAVTQSLAANRIISIEAILNGTSNFILSRMLDCGQSYEEVLREAQERGYAEADSRMDVDGTDAAQKLAILTELAFGTRIQLNDIVQQGIQNLELQDLELASELGYRIKLLATSRLSRGRLEVSVQPTLVRAGRAIAQTNGADNIVAIEGDSVGLLKFAGAGAGQMPTASAVVADLIDYASGRAAITFRSLLRLQSQPPVPLQPQEDLSRRYYLRMTVADRPHVLADIADVLGRNEISISSVRQDETPEVEGDEAVARLVIMTHRTTEGRLRAADKEISSLPSQRGPCIRLPISE